MTARLGDEYSTSSDSNSKKRSFLLAHSPNIGLSGLMDVDSTGSVSKKISSIDDFSSVKESDEILYCDGIQNMAYECNELSNVSSVDIDTNESNISFNISRDNLSVEDYLYDKKVRARYLLDNVSGRKKAEVYKYYSKYSLAQLSRYEKKFFYDLQNRKKVVFVCDLCYTTANDLINEDNTTDFNEWEIVCQDSSTTPLIRHIDSNHQDLKNILLSKVHIYIVGYIC